MSDCEINAGARDVDGFGEESDAGLPTFERRYEVTATTLYQAEYTILRA
jgi:hypothetical protein